eukprot:TRINITY_DN8389_c0_g1_i2.p2 TRINITY_DN8389_c0_g1~~TRINITY_DN8389_c0_g1_i2.p2  ORF type:complete len:154 (-),score=33.17 TRINITY_DN8389_c0_g1_i2:38-439(-)
MCIRDRLKLVEESENKIRKLKKFKTNTSKLQKLQKMKMNLLANKGDDIQYKRRKPKSDLVIEDLSNVEPESNKDNNAQAAISTKRLASYGLEIKKQSLHLESLRLFFMFIDPKSLHIQVSVLFFIIQTCLHNQ